MRVTIVCFGAMRDYLPAGSSENRGEVELPAGATIAELIRAIDAPEALVHSVLLDGAHAEPARMLSEGVEVTLMPPFSGGGH
jgi:molybdopterin converting factor small subunit